MSETDSNPPIEEATLDLLVKQVIEGLQPAEQRALDALDTAVTSALADELERAAAAAVLVGLDTSQPLPEALRARIEAAAPSDLARPRRVSEPPPAGLPPSAAGGAGLLTPSRARPPRSRRALSAGWWAAAACLVLALIGWLRPLLTAPGAGSPPPLAAARSALLARPGTVNVPLQGTGDPNGGRVMADVVWNPQLQQGVIRFTGLPANDPAVHQYQLWIFDAGRDARYPVDGGVFDVPAGRTEVLVPIHARLPVHAATAFAVTLENPGGVVVSEREHVLALGKVT